MFLARFPTEAFFPAPFLALYITQPERSTVVKWHRLGQAGVYLFGIEEDDVVDAAQVSLRRLLLFVVPQNRRSKLRIYMPAILKLSGDNRGGYCV